MIQAIPLAETVEEKDLIQRHRYHYRIIIVALIAVLLCIVGATLTATMIFLKEFKTSQKDTDNFGQIYLEYLNEYKF